MRKILISLAAAAVIWPAAIAIADDAPVAGKSIETIKTDIVAVARGWKMSDLMSADVKNDKKESIGHIADAIVTQDDQLTYAIVGVGGFLGIGEKYVAIPVELFTVNGKSEVTLPGATKKTLEELPEFKYSS